MSDEEEWDEDEEWDDEDTADRGPTEPGHLTGVCLGYLAMLPLIVIYELGVRQSGSGMRNTSELLIFQLFAPLGGVADLARYVALCALAVGALIVCYRRGVVPIPEASRLVLEGGLGALVMGPLLVWTIGLLGDGIPSFELHARMQAPDPNAPPDLSQAALVFGGAAYEELLFRVLLYSFCFLLARQVYLFFGLRERGGRIVAEVTAALVSSLLFAALHLEAFLPASWSGGEPFEAGVFAWRALAGLCFCGLFRWRGPGVAAWTHGLFNVALLLGAGPEVLL